MNDQDQHLSDEEIDRIADKVIEKFGNVWVEREQHHDDHRWIQAKRDSEFNFSESRRRIVEKIVGTAGALGLMGLLGLFGKVIIETIASGLP